MPLILKRTSLSGTKQPKKSAVYTADEAVGNDDIWTWLYPDGAYRNETLTYVSAIVHYIRANSLFCKCSISPERSIPRSSIDLA